jgi:nicotinamidase-related amidase
MSKQAQVVVDMQEYFCRPGHALDKFIASFGEPGAADWYWHWLDATVVPNIARLLAGFRARGDLVLFTEFGSRAADGSDLPLWARRHNEMAMSALGERIYLPLSDPAARVIGELAPAASDVVVQKTTSGPLAGTDIAARLRAAGVESVIVTGVVTDVCVTGMARELADADFDVVVVADACGAPMRESHEWALRVAIPTFASIVVADDVLGAGERAVTSAARATGP